jgi:putative endonuclease
MNEYYIYIMSNKSRMLHIGITNNLERRIYEHQMKLIPGFTQRYGLTRLVYYESTSNIIAAIEREKEIKGWVRRRKTAPIHSLNPEWRDLSEEWSNKNVTLKERSDWRISGKGGQKALPSPDIPRFVQDDRKNMVIGRNG